MVQCTAIHEDEVIVCALAGCLLYVSGHVSMKSVEFDSCTFKCCWWKWLHLGLRAYARVARQKLHPRWDTSQFLHALDTFSYPAEVLYVDVATTVMPLEEDSFVFGADVGLLSWENDDGTLLLLIVLFSVQA